MTTSTSAPIVPSTRSRRRRTTLRAAAVLGAAVAAVLVWAVAVPLGGVDLGVEMSGRFQPVGLGAVIGVSLAVGLLGWALLAVLELRTLRATALWTGVALTVAVLSLVGPMASAVTSAAAAVLVALHLVVASVLVPVMRRSSSARRP